MIIFCHAVAAIISLNTQVVTGTGNWTIQGKPTELNLKFFLKEVCTFFQLKVLAVLPKR